MSRSRRQPPATRPPDEGALIARQQITVQQRSGPLPDPEALGQYETICPGAADRIIQMAEKEQDFAHAYHDRGQLLNGVAVLAGQIFGFVLGISGIWAGYLLLMNDKPTQGFAIMILAIGSLVASSIWGAKNRSSKEDKVEKD